MSTQPLVLVADDEPRITKLVSIALGEEGFRVVTAGSGEEALAKAEEVRPDIVLLDIVMPDLDGIEVMRQLRERRPVAVILLTAKGSTADKAKGLDLGADDYIAKPFHPDELAARVRAVLRRSSGAQPGSGVLKFDDVEIDLERRMVTRDGELVQLSRTEWLLLQHLAANAGKVVLHTELLTKVWGPEYRDDLQYLRVWVSRVRRKLGAEPGEPGRIKTFQGIGYLLDVEPPVVPESPQVVVPDDLVGAHRVRLRSGRTRRWRIRRAGPQPAMTAPIPGRSTALRSSHAAIRTRDGPHRGRCPERFRRSGRQPERGRRRRPSSRAINREIEMARNNGAIVVATQDWHPPSTPHFAKDGGIWPVHCVADTWGAELHPDLALPDDALRVRKGANGEDGYSGFTMRDPVDGETTPTELEGLLRDAGVERVVVDGPRHRLLRQGDGPRRAAPGLRDARPHRCVRRRSISSRATASGPSTSSRRPASGCGGR